MKRAGLRLRQTIASLVSLQAKATGTPAEADRAYVEALKSGDPDVRLWALFAGYQRVETPSEELSDTFLDLWRGRDLVRRYIAMHAYNVAQ
jgi:hypothetical protein